MKITFFEVNEEDIHFFKNNIKDFELEFYDFPLNEERSELIAESDIISVFIHSKINEKVLKNAKKLKFICTRSTGYDHIDLNVCKERNILVSNVPSYGVETVAEHTFALLLAISRKIIESFERTRKGDFNLENLRGFELKGKTLGIIGAGKIGRRVAEIAKAFGMKVIAYDIFPNYEEAKRIGFEYVDLETLLKNSDIITLHANLTKENYHLINEESFKKMKDGVIIINTARGALIDTKALINNIKNGKVKAAGLDVLEGEALIKEEIELLVKNKLEKDSLESLVANHILIEMEDKEKNIIITPHNAFNSVEAIEEIRQTTLQNIFSFLKGNPINLVKI
ncbi:MAG: NAD(P)-dependent oxidoreductase [Candidatus Aenigmatarchaeota archaeon]